MSILGGDVRPLLHQGAPVVPEAVVESQFVLQFLGLVHARVGVLPLEGGKPGQQEHGDGDPQVGCCHVDPDVKRERHQEREQVLRRRGLLLVQDADT